MVPGIFVIKRNTAGVISTPAKNKNFKMGEKIIENNVVKTKNNIDNDAHSFKII